MKLLRSLILLCLAGSALSQTSTTTQTQSVGGGIGVSGAVTAGHCASFVSATQIQDAGATCGSGSGTLTPSGTITTGQIALWASSTSLKSAAMSQDCTMDSSAVITCLKTNNVAFGSFATQADPMTTTGDILSFSGGIPVRVAVGSTGCYLFVTGGIPAWDTLLCNNGTQLIYTGSAGYSGLSLTTTGAFGGMVSYGQGTLATTTPNAWNVSAPASVTGTPIEMLPGAAATGFRYTVNASGTMTDSIGELAGDCTTSGSLTITCGGGSSHVVVNNALNTFTSAGRLDLTLSPSTNGFILPSPGGSCGSVVAGAECFNGNNYIGNIGGSPNAIAFAGSTSTNVIPKWNSSTLALFSNSSITDDATTVSTTERINSSVGFRIGNAAASRHVLVGDGTNYIDGVLAIDDLSDGAAVAETDSSNTFTASNSFASTADKVGQASIITDSAGINTTETVIVKSAALAVNRLQAGTVLRVTAWGVCTDTVANTSTFAIRIGTAGTTSDTLVVSLTTGASGTTGTNVPFKLDMDITVRTTGSGTSATVDARDLLISGANGIQGATTVQAGTPSLTGFDTTAANIISLTYKSAAATTTSTFKQAFIEVVNQ